GLVHLAGGTAPVNHTHLVRRHPVPPAGDVLPPLPLVVVPGGGRVLGLPARGHVELGQDRVGDCSHGVGWAALRVDLERAQRRVDQRHQRLSGVSHPSLLLAHAGSTSNRSSTYFHSLLCSMRHRVTAVSTVDRSSSITPASTSPSIAPLISRLSRSR